MTSSDSQTPWQGDAISLVEAFRSGERSPVEELEATYAAIDASELNAVCNLDRDAALATARDADVTKPFGGVPIGVKELESVAGWPQTEASVPLKDHVAERDSTNIGRLRNAGAVLLGQTTSSEFGGVNLTRTVLHGATLNPWDFSRTPGGSSGGTAAAVAGGLMTLGTAGDGGGSIRIPAGFCGMYGLKATYGRVPKGPGMQLSSMTAVLGTVSRSVRDTARWFDCVNGFDSRDPYSLPRVEGWEAGLGTQDVRGMTVAISPDLGAAVVHPVVAAMVTEWAEKLAADAGLRIVDVPIELPEMGYEWALSGLANVLADLGDLYPDCADDLTPEIRLGLKIASQAYDVRARARVELTRAKVNEAMASVFDKVDFVIAATNPDVAFGAEGPLRMKVGDVDVLPQNNGALTIPANAFGNPSAQLPIGLHDGLPVGAQIMGRHHSEQLLLDLSLVAEREHPWPLVAPTAPL